MTGGPAEQPSEAPAFAVMPDDWLSRVLNRTSCRVTPIPDEAEERLKAAAHKQFHAALGQAAFLSAVIESDRLRHMHLLEEIGFRHVETRLTLEHPGVPLVTSFPMEKTRAALAADVEYVAEIAARSFQYNRFHMDPCFSRDKADRIKREWVRGYFNGTRGDAMIVAQRDDAVAGFLLLIEGDAGQPVIDLMAVAPEHRGHGLARALIAAAIDRYDPDTPLRVGTQVTNRPSLALYGRCGFQVVSGAQVFHYHNQRSLEA